MKQTAQAMNTTSLLTAKFWNSLQGMCKALQSISQHIEPTSSPKLSAPTSQNCRTSGLMQELEGAKYKARVSALEAFLQQMPQSE